MIRTLATLAAVFVAATAWSDPCTTATQSCTEWVQLGPQARSLVYRTYALETRNDKITRAVVMVHGAGRDADNYFRTIVAAAFLAGALDDAVVIAPRFASNDGRGCKDTLAPREVNWPCNGDSWRSGGASETSIGNGGEKLTSFDFADEILKKLANKALFPNVKRIVVTGHSAGGQFVNRYEMANRVHDSLGVPVTYVVANPSSYAYLDATRPREEGRDFGPFRDARNCTTYDDWPYGLEHRTGYASRLTDDQLKTQLSSRPTTYIVGELDTLPLAGFDSSCPAMAQGPNRQERGKAFERYVAEKVGAHHTLFVVPLCGHNARCMFTADPVLAMVFPPVDGATTK